MNTSRTSRWYSGMGGSSSGSGALDRRLAANRRRASIPRDRSIDEQFVPQVVAEQAGEEPSRPLQRPGQQTRVEPVVRPDALGEVAELTAGRQPVEDRLAKAELVAVDQRRGHVLDQRALEQVLGPTE